MLSWCHCGFGPPTALILIPCMKQLKMSKDYFELNSRSMFLCEHINSCHCGSVRQGCLYSSWLWTWHGCGQAWLKMSLRPGRHSLRWQSQTDSRAALYGTRLISGIVIAGVCINTCGLSLNHRCEWANKLLKQVSDQLHEKSMGSCH